MNKKMVLKVTTITLGLLAASSSFAQSTKNTMRVFTKPDGTKISAKVDKYSTTTQMVRVRTEESEVIELPFDQISAENQKVILEWKMDQIVRTMDVSHKRIRQKSSTSYKLGSNMSKEEEPISHILTLKNKERIPVTGLEIRYGIAYRRKDMQGVGVAKSGTDTGYHLQTLPAIDLDARETKVIEPEPFFLQSFVDESSNYGRRSGDGGGKSEEKFQGVVFRFFRNGELIREVASPPSLANRKFTLPPNETREVDK